MWDQVLEWPGLLIPVVAITESRRNKYSNFRFLENSHLAAPIISISVNTLWLNLAGVGAMLFFEEGSYAAPLKSCLFLVLTTTHRACCSHNISENQWILNTLERFGVALFVLAHLLCGSRFHLFLDNLECVYLLCRVIPSFVKGVSAWEICPLLTLLLWRCASGTADIPGPGTAAQPDYGFQLQTISQLRKVSVLACHLSRAWEQVQQQATSLLLPSLFCWLDERWGW